MLRIVCSSKNCNQTEFFGSNQSSGFWIWRLTPPLEPKLFKKFLLSFFYHHLCFSWNEESILWDNLRSRMEMHMKIRYVSLRIDFKVSSSKALRIVGAHVIGAMFLSAHPNTCYHTEARKITMNDMKMNHDHQKLFL